MLVSCVAGVYSPCDAVSCASQLASDDPACPSRLSLRRLGWGIPQWGPSEWVCQPPWAILQVIWGTLNFPLRWKLPHSFLPNCDTVRLGGNVLVIQDIPPGSVISGACWKVHIPAYQIFLRVSLKPLPCSA